MATTRLSLFRMYMTDGLVPFHCLIVLFVQSLKRSVLRVDGDDLVSLCTITFIALNGLCCFLTSGSLIFNVLDYLFNVIDDLLSIRSSSTGCLFRFRFN